ncbi:MAG: ROK family protein [Myxococcales bacterium]|nr:ROK family protein [Myxococcales bacterium]
MLLRLIWDEPGGVSRADLARRSGLSRSTVSGITANLIDEGLVVEGRVVRSRSGRPPILLRFQDHRFVVVGIELGSSHVSCCRMDLRGDLERIDSEECAVQDEPKRALGLATDLIDAALSDVEDGRRVLGIGVAVPSPLDRSEPGRLSARILPKWVDTDLGGELYERYRIPVLIDNDANLGALAEAWWGAGRGVPHFTYVKVATGVGAGHIIGGEIFRGASGIAGEIGHSAVAPSGRLCRCGLSGCLEAEVGSTAVLAKARERLANGASSALSADDLTLSGMVAAAKDGDPVATEIITDAGQHLGIAMANLVNLMNPARVVLGGRLTSAGDLLVRPLRRAMAERALATNVEDTEVRVTELGRGAIARGAGTLVMQWALENAHVLTPTAPAPSPRASTRLLSGHSGLR